MQYQSFVQHVGKWLLVAACMGFGLAMAEAEPTMSQVYSTAQAGKLEQAQIMIQQVLISHPNSAKAYFVQAELYARQGNLARAREALAGAEKLAPGLPFAKTEAVQALRSQLAARSAAGTGAGGSAVHYAAPVSPAPSSSSWALPLLLAGGVIAAGYFMFRRRVPASLPAQAVYGSQGDMGGPQSFGMGPGAVPGGMQQPPYGQPVYGQPPVYGQQAAGSGLGGRLMGGVATGLAVGAGVMAAEAIGRNLMGNHNAAPGPVDNFSSNNDYQALERNTDMGGQNFGINDTRSWDDGSSSDAGGDWDSN